MQFSLNKKDISDKLQLLNSVITAKASMMVLANFRIDADVDTNEITIVATDLNITTIVKVQANVLKSGSILVSAKRLTDIIANLPDNSINFTLKDDHLIIECLNSAFKLSFMDNSLFPEISFIDNENEFIFDAQDFKKLIQNTVFCASTDAIHTICNGVFFKIEQNQLTMAATDTKRIGEAKLSSEFNCEEPYEIVLPPRALNYIEKSINPELDEIIIKFDERRISFFLKNTLLISNKFEGRFPTYTVAFKNLPETTLVIDKNSIKDAIRRVSLLSDDEDKLIKILLNEKIITIMSLVSEGGKAKEDITGFSYDGDDVMYCINSKLLLSIVNAIESDEIVMKFRTNVEPIWVENNCEFKNMEIRFVIMPMRIVSGGTSGF